MAILDLAYRSRQLNFRRTQISQWLTQETAELREEVEARKSEGEAVDDEYFSSRVSDIELEATRQEKDALATYGMLEGTDARISPLRRALAVWGLTGDDIGVLSIHGTSTGANVRKFGRIKYPFTDSLCRRRTRPRSGTRSSHRSSAPKAMLSQSWPRRVSSVTPRVDPLLGRWQVSCNQCLLVSFRATGILSEFHSLSYHDISLTVILQQHRCYVPTAYVPHVPGCACSH